MAAQDVIPLAAELAVVPIRPDHRVVPGARLDVVVARRALLRNVAEAEDHRCAAGGRLAGRVRQPRLADGDVGESVLVHVA